MVILPIPNQVNLDGLLFLQSSRSEDALENLLSKSDFAIFKSALSLLHPSNS